MYEKVKFASIPQLLDCLDDSKKLPEESVSEDDSKTVLKYIRQKWLHLCRNVLKLPCDWESKTSQGWSGNVPNIIKAISLLKHK